MVAHCQGSTNLASLQMERLLNPKVTGTTIDYLLCLKKLAKELFDSTGTQCPAPA
jgi:hypothetical protein